MKVRIIEPSKEVQRKKKRVCAYARVSTDNKSQEESLENQIQYYENIISSNPDYEFVGVFADKGISGTTDKRPEFQRMLSFCRERKVDLIITKSISRFARNTTIVLSTVRELRNIGIEVRFEKENINTLSGDGEFMLTVLSSFAQEESKNVSDNLKWRAKRKFMQGELIINTNRFLGYDKNEFGELVINREEAEIVTRIFNEYIEGKGVTTITKELNNDNIPTVTGARWQEATILGILKNEKYKGDAILQKYYTPENKKKYTVRNKGQLDSYYVEDNHSPIVPREMWEQVQIEIRRRAEAKGNISGQTNKYRKRYELSGMLYCSKCGSTLKRRVWNSNASCKKVVWQCSNYISNGKSACSGTVIEDLIVSKLNIKEETIVKEDIKNGKKHYSYTSKREPSKFDRTYREKKKKNSSVLKGVYGPARATIKL